MSGHHGFELLREREIPELESRARLYRHTATGAEVLSLSNQDENKVFGITFRTPPEDSTGLPHILEHSVLCGSRKYPVKEPFVELMKGSLNTFLNAFTFPDKTCYPVASQNRQDFYNLMDVYLDAVFHPRLTPDLLKQEGWHYELDDVSAPLSYKGVVFNEMKGAQAVPERALNMAIERALLPETPYAVDSGGVPAEMTNLTWEQFSAFHERYYHPSNARVFFYGDDPEEARLERLATYLDEFDAIEVGSEIPLQPRLDEPTRVETRYPAGAEEAAEGKGLVAVSWVLPEVVEAERALAFHILTYLLAGTPAAPLRKALIDSGLGEGLVGGDLDVHYRQMLFSVGLKGSPVESAGDVESLILSTLQELVEQGLDAEGIEAALNAVEFRLRENNSGSFPRGLVLMLNALTAWTHDGDPLAVLAFEGPLEAIRARLAAEPNFFETLIDTHLLSNPHRTTTIVAPDPKLSEEWDAEERARLDRIGASLDESARARLVEESRRLREAQERPDRPEDLATIPTLTLADLERNQPAIPLQVTEVAGSGTLLHDLPTNGIVYLDVGLDLRRLSADLLPYAPLLGRALLEMGTARQSFVELSQRIDRTTGGIRPEIFTTDRIDGSGWAGYLFLRGKATVGRSGELAAILAEVLLEAQLDDADRFRRMVLEEKAALESAMIPQGHRVINRRLRGHFTPGYRADEQMSGVDQLFFLRTLADEIESDWGGVLSRLEAVRAQLLDRESLLLNVTLPGDQWGQVEAQIKPLVGALPSAAQGTTDAAAPPLPPREGLVIPAQVNYVGLGANLPALGYEVGGASLVVTRYLRNAYLWDRLRVRGGAYGAFSLIDQRSGTFTFLSYRDPNLTATVEAYREAADFLRTLEISPEELTKSVIGTIGDIDAYQLPDARGFTSMSRHVAGVTEAFLQTFRDQVLGIGPAAFRDFADAVAAVGEQGQMTVLASEEALTRANEQFDPPLEIIRIL